MTGGGGVMTTSVSELSSVVTAAIRILINHYANEYCWMLWINGSSHDMRCTDAESFSYLSNLFYCIFWHVKPQLTLDFGAMRVVCTPHKSSDFNISVHVLFKDTTSEEKD